MTTFNRRVRKAAALAVIAVYAAPGLVLADDAALCITRGDRAPVEDSRCMHIHDASAHDVTREAAGVCRASPGACCGSCLDMPFSRSALPAREAPQPQASCGRAAAPGRASEPGDAFDCAGPVLPPGRHRARPLAAFALKALRSVMIVV